MAHLLCFPVMERWHAVPWKHAIYRSTDVPATSASHLPDAGRDEDDAEGQRCPERYRVPGTHRREGTQSAFLVLQEHLEELEGDDQDADVAHELGVGPPQ